MKRDFLKNLGLEEEVIDKIITENGKDITTYKAKLDELTETIAVKDEILKQKNEKISEF